MKGQSLSPEFVEYIPPSLNDGILYVSIPYAMAVHLCACGCRNKVVTPISPAEWQLFYDGESVSLTPSIGNWEFLCHSHYWIRRNQIKWAVRLTDAEIAEGKRRDARELEDYFASRRDRPDEIAPTVSRQRPSALHRILQFLRPH